MSRNPKSSSIPSEIRPSIFSIIETYGPKDKNLLRSGLLTPKQLGESLLRIFLLTLVFWFIAFGSALLIDQLTGFNRQFQVAGILWFPVTILFLLLLRPRFLSDLISNLLTCLVHTDVLVLNNSVVVIRLYLAC